MNDDPEGTDDEADAPGSSARRAFLRRAGAYAAVTPPVMVTMMTVMSKPALASGSGTRGPDTGNSGKDKGEKRGADQGKKRGWYKSRDRG